VEEIDVPTAHAMWRAGDLIIDVRLPGEYAAGHVAGARNLPLRDLPARVRDLPPGQIVTVCSTGIRSLRAAEMLGHLGRTAFSVRGGTKAWAAAGHPIVRGPDPGPHRRPSWWKRRLT
jgi:rhodanese-related sulfurtransferase